MLGLAESSSTYWLKFDNCVHWDFNGHATFNRRVSEIRHETLQNTNMTHNQSRNDLLLEIYDYACESSNQITIAFAAWESDRDEQKIK